MGQIGAWQRRRRQGPGGRLAGVGRHRPRFGDPHPGTGVTSLQGALGAAPPSTATGSSAPDSDSPGANQAPNPDSWLTETFQAPEGQWSATADRVRLDVFGLGALAFYVIADKPAATTRQALRTRLQEQSGLDLSVELPQIGSTLRSLVLKATRPAPTQRTGDVSTVLAQLAQVERETSDEDTTTGDPLEATPGSVLDGRFRLERRLGQGSTAVGLLVTDLQAAEGSFLGSDVRETHMRPA